MDEKTVTVPEWLDPELLTQFIDELREAGYNIGIPQYIAAHDLVLTLTTHGELHKPEQLKTLLGPILCGSPREQTDFQQRFEQWVELFSHHRVPPETVDKAVEELSTELDTLKTRSQRLKQTLILVVCLILAILLPLRWSAPQKPEAGTSPIPSTPSTPSELPKPVDAPEPVNPEPVDAPESQENWEIILTICLISLSPGVAFLIWRLWWHWRAHLFLQRRSTTQLPELQKISVPEFEECLFPPVLLLRTAQNLRRRIRLPTNALDIDKTIRACLNQGGWLTPIYRYRQVLPEYLFLIDRASYRDHQAKFAEDLIHQLSQDGVYVTSYFFDGDPRICFPQGQDTLPQRLQNIAFKYRQYRLIVVADPEIFFNPVTGKLESWVESILSWEKPAVLTPKSVEYWGWSEVLLAQELIVLPITPKGVWILGQVLHQGVVTYQVSEEAQPPFPELLSIRPQRWIERNPPPPEQIWVVLTQLQAYLGRQGFYWLAACAVFPELHWTITLYLGTVLTSEGGQSFLEICSLPNLARLPWFRSGYMPDWFRSYLIATLTREQDQQVRAAFQTLLATAVQGEVGALQLEIARQHQQILPKLTNSMLYLLSRRSSKDNLLRDYLFLSFMMGRPKLAIEAPENLNQLKFHPDQFGELKDLQTKPHQKRRWRNILSPLSILRSMVLISGVTTVMVTGIRFIGLLQPLELMAYDVLLSLRPPENPDDRIVIVEITPRDLERVEISNEKLLELLEALKENYQPQIIGLNVYVDQPAKVGNDRLVTHLAQRDDVIAACLVVPEELYPYPATIPGAIAPRTSDVSISIPWDRLGFTNVPFEDFLGFNLFIEPDFHFIRRYQLTIDESHVSSTCNTGFSLGLLLAIEYLETIGITPVLDPEGYMENDQGYIEFSQTGTVLEELEDGDGGGYRWRDIEGYQVLLNYRSPHPQQGAFRRVSVSQIIQGEIDQSDLEGRVVLIGYTADIPGQYSAFHYTPYSFGQWPPGQRMAGVVIHAHLVSQILSSVLDNRPQLSVWPPFYDVLWIGIWSFIGGVLTWLFPSAKLALVGSATVIPLSGLCFIVLFQFGLWAPLIPPAFAVFLAAWGVHRMARITNRVKLQSQK
ncbi:MAG: CHASE2 domain-containing protein [Leptolyngbyaceae cyanobacterium MO_188.B28]|nr:CHASE2 domain-containing protein [Leptolyngbyaceae cyanobacterium MO_188.B28]